MWQEVSTARIGFEDRGLTSTSASGRDGVNVLTFDETGEFIQAPPGTGMIAVTRIHSDPETGKITDADIVFNGRDFTFGDGAQLGPSSCATWPSTKSVTCSGSTTPPLEGPPANRPTMNPFYTDGGPGEGFTLEADDVAGVSMMYPAPTFALSTEESPAESPMSKAPPSSAPW